MIERLLIVAAISVALYIAYRWWVRTQLNLAEQKLDDELLQKREPGVPMIVYFTTPTCIPCKTQQRPALQQLAAQTRVHIVEVDASQEQETAQRWGVMTAPTTFVFDPNGRPTAVNYGAVDAHTLIQQLGTTKIAS